eukprot:TRINITY_DN58232_c0_g1_i1.p1 TRINITY_DN58232_c0_g1~~TRINITY_DN58232_c0_g1_i1.p1  ORF type:complete len:245 (+),score=35.90 TRINITY_DN58232_c0_g1_i1:75-809(+)
MFVEVANTLLLSYVGTECALRGFRYISWKPLVATICANVVAWTTFHSDVANRFDEFLSKHVYAELLALALLCIAAALLTMRSVLPLRANMFAALKTWFPSKRIGALALLCAACGALRTFMIVFKLDRSSEEVSLPPVCRRVILAMILYPMACYFDLLRHHPKLTIREFGAFVPRALLITAGLFGPAVVAIAAFFLVLSSAMEGLGADPHILNWPIYYGVLYGPFGAFYFSVKRQFLRKQSELPT